MNVKYLIMLAFFSLLSQTALTHEQDSLIMAFGRQQLSDLTLPGYPPATKTEKADGNEITVYPLLSSGKVRVQIPHDLPQVRLVLVDPVRRMIFTRSYQPPSLIELQLPEMAGAYTLQIWDGEGIQKSTTINKR